MEFNDYAVSLTGHLYFEYLITLEKLNKVRNKTASEHLRDKIRNIPSAKILLIDDNLGWHTFFKAMFADNPNVEIQCLGENFNKLEFNEIGSIIKNKVNEFSPNVIILDFRLMEDRDAEIKDDMRDISGYKVLADILKGTYVHPQPSYGRQVLIFTATDRIENILMLRNGNADGFILKEKPEHYNGKEITKDVISKMISSLNLAIERSDFLIPLNDKLNELNELSCDSTPQLKETIEIVSESVRLITQNNRLDEGVLKLSYLNLFSVLECLKPSTIKYLNTFIQEKAPNDILKYWNNIDEIRNSLAHGDKNVRIDGRKKQISIVLIKEWHIILGEFIKKFIIHHIPDALK